MMNEVFTTFDFRLEETSQDLQQTKEKLSQEEFICSELSSVHDTLYNTAGQVQTSFTGASRQRFTVSLFFFFLSL